MSRRAPLLIGRKGIEILFGLVSFAILARSLSKEQFAVYSLVFSFIAILRLTTLPGIGTAVTQAFARGLPGDLFRTVKLSMIGSILGAVVLFGISIWHYSLDNEMTGRAFLVSSILFPFFCGLKFWKNAVFGLERYGKILIYDGVASGLKCGAIFICSKWFSGLLYPFLVAALLAPALVNVIATVEQTLKLPKNADSESKTVNYGIRITLYQLPSVLVQQLDKVVLFYFISPAALAIYAVALRIPELSRAVVGEINATLGPVFSREPIYTKAIYSFSILLWFMYLVISVIGAFFVVPYLLPALAGNKYLTTIPYAQIMTVGVALGFLGDIQFRYIRSQLHSRSYFFVTTSKAIFDSIIIIVLAYFFELKGIVAAYSLRYFGHTLITNFVIRNRYLNVKPLPKNI